MLVHRSNEDTQNDSQTDAVQPTTESEQASTSTQADQNPIQRIRNWLDRNKDPLMALGIVISLTGNAYAVIK